MKKTKVFYLVVVLAVSALLLSNVNAWAVSEDARRHMARGQAAVEMAKSPEEYGSAMREFQEASLLAPDWPDPHYHLGLVQEKSGKFREAVASLKEYLRLAPDAPDAAKVKELIYKLEYKAEQVLSVPEIIDVLVSFEDSQTWQSQGATIYPRQAGGCRIVWTEFSFEREGSDAVRVLRADLYYRKPDTDFQTLKVTGPVLKYMTTVNVCGHDGVDNGISCDSVMQNEVEVVSKETGKSKTDGTQGRVRCGSC